MAGESAGVGLPGKCPRARRETECRNHAFVHGRPEHGAESDARGAPQGPEPAAHHRIDGTCTDAKRPVSGGVVTLPTLVIQGPAHRPRGLLGQHPIRRLSTSRIVFAAAGPVVLPLVHGVGDLPHDPGRDRARDGALDQVLADAMAVGTLDSHGTDLRVNAGRGRSTRAPMYPTVTSPAPRCL